MCPSRSSLGGELGSSSGRFECDHCGTPFVYLPKARHTYDRVNPARERAHSGSSGIRNAARGRRAQAAAGTSLDAPSVTGLVALDPACDFYRCKFERRSVPEWKHGEDSPDEPPSGGSAWIQVPQATGELTERQT